MVDFFHGISLFVGGTTLFFVFAILLLLGYVIRKVEDRAIESRMAETEKKIASVRRRGPMRKVSSCVYKDGCIEAIVFVKMSECPAYVRDGLYRLGYSEDDTVSFPARLVDGDWNILFPDGSGESAEMKKGIDDATDNK